MKRRHLHGDLESEIEAVEHRISKRRERLVARAGLLRRQLGSSLLSPGVLSAAATLGFGIGRMLVRRRAPARPTRSSSKYLGLLAGLGMSALRLRFGAPGRLIGNFLSSLVRHRTRGSRT